MTGRGRGKEVSLQTEIESQEDWEENIAKEGLLIIDVFQEWCGPCKAMLPVFKRIKNESGDELLRFAVAKADSVEALERYRGKCEPCFLFYAGGVLVEVVHGADSPGLNRAIIDQLANEHKVLEGGATRHEKVDPKFPVGGISRKTHRQSTLDGKVAEVVVSESEGSSDEEESEARRSFSDMQFGGEQIMFDSLPEASGDGVFVEREVTLCIIKPDVVADGKIKDVLQKIRGAGIEVLEELEKHLTYEEASELYAPIADEPYTEDLMQLMSSGPCEFLILSKGEFGENIVHEFKEMLGPVGVADAKERAPKSLRALFGKQDSPSNGIYGSHTPADAKKNIPLFFPNFVSKKVSITHIQPPKEPLTIGIIRPEALDLRRDEILQTIKDRGYEILLSKEMTMTEEEVETFFAREKEDHGYHEMAECMVSGPCLVMALTNHKETIVQDWLNTIGPKEQGGAAVKAPDCLQNKFGSLTTSVEQFHGTPSEDLVDAEADFFFPMEQTVVIVKPDAYSKRDHIMQLFRNAGLFIAGRKELRMTRRQAVQTYSKCEDKEFYDELLEFMTSGMSCVMILSARKAVDRTRLLVGTIDTAPSPSQSSHPLDNLEEQQKDSTEDFEEEEQPEYEDKLAAFKFTGLRKQFGTDMLRNAIHASSSVEAAKEEISMFWGDVHFDEEGCMKKKKKVKRETICEARGKLTTKEDDATEGDEVKESQETDQQHAQDAEEGTGEPEHALEGESGETEHAHTEESGETEHAHPEESGETEHAEAGDSGEAEHAQDRDSGGAGHVHFATDEIAEEHREKHTDEQEQGGEQRNENNKTPENVTAGTHEAHHEEHHEEHHEGHHEEQHNAHHEEHHEEHHDADNKEHHEEHHEAHHEAHHDEHHDEHHDADHKEHHDAGEPAHTDKGKEATETSEPPAEQTNEQPEATQ